MALCRLCSDGSRWAAPSVIPRSDGASLELNTACKGLNTPNPGPISPNAATGRVSPVMESNTEVSRQMQACKSGWLAIRKRETCRNQHAQTLIVTLFCGKGVQI